MVGSVKNTVEQVLYNLCCTDVGIHVIDLLINPTKLYGPQGFTVIDTIFQHHFREYTLYKHHHIEAFGPSLSH